MFRRFMIVCWGIFTICAAISVFSFIQLEILDDQFVLGTAGDESITPEVLDDLNQQARLRHLSASPFYEPAFVARAVALVILIWNLFCHTAHWIWMGRKEQ